MLTRKHLKHGREIRMTLPKEIDIVRSGDLIDIELQDYPDGEGGFISICLTEEEAVSLASHLMNCAEDIHRCRVAKLTKGTFLEDKEKF